MNSPASPNFEYFDDPYERAMIAECGFRIAEYVQAEDVGTVVLIDRAARNLYIPILDAHRQLDPEAETPSIYFLNPAGFLSPEVHSIDEYVKRVAQGMSEESGMSDRDFVEAAKLDTELLSLIIGAGEHDYINDAIKGGRQTVASRFTGLADKAIRRDKKFNGRVLVMDACIHSGAAMDGISTALQDIGIIDVRTGAVNNITNHTNCDPDFVVFQNHEILDLCKPFGPQHGLSKIAGVTMTTQRSKQGLSDESKLARKELHMIMQDANALRDAFNHDTRLRQPTDLTFLLGAIALLVTDEIGYEPLDNQSIDVSQGGILLPPFSVEQIPSRVQQQPN